MEERNVLLVMTTRIAITKKNSSKLNQYCYIDYCVYTKG